MTKTMYVTVRIDYEADERYDESEVQERVPEMVTERANAHNHTIEDGIHIVNVESCGINE